MMIWKTDYEYKTVEEAILGLSGQTSEQLLNPSECPAQNIQGMVKAFQFVKRAITASVPIVIVGDYDADGMTSTAILLDALHFLGVKPTFVIPHRFTEGYGINRRIVDGIKDPSLIITVDNGISAVDPIAYAKEKGHRVVILDHHLPAEFLPNADVIVDPHVEPDKNGFVEYCGAGLALKLCSLLFADPELREAKKYERENLLTLWRELVVLAGIGTIADCMDLVGDNRAIVMKALKYLNNKNLVLSAGLRYLVELAVGTQEGEINHDTVAFRIAPLLNATSRLHDVGSMSVVKALICTNPTNANKYSAKMQEFNEKRKELTKEWVEKVEKKLQENPSLVSPPIIIYEKDLHEGLCGIVAGRLVELHHMPAIVFTTNHQTGELKGSARSVEGFHIKEMLDAMGDVFTAYGGHEGAAGLSVANVEKLAEFKDKAKKYMAGMVFEDAAKYDVSIKEDEVVAAHDLLNRYEPFGKGVPKPVIRIDNFHAKPGYNNVHCRYMGANDEHFKLNGDGYNVIAFGRGSDYKELGEPADIALIGKIESNTFRGRVTPQINVIDFTG